MKYDDFHPVLRTALGANQAFRLLGFSRDDLYIYKRDDGIVLYVLVGKDKSFSVECGKVDMTNADFEQKWAEAVTAINGVTPQEDADRIWYEFRDSGDMTAFVAGIVAKGFKLPIAGRNLH